MPLLFRLLFPSSLVRDRAPLCIYSSIHKLVEGVDDGTCDPYGTPRKAPSFGYENSIYLGDGNLRLSSTNRFLLQQSLKKGSCKQTDSAKPAVDTTSSVEGWVVIKNLQDRRSRCLGYLSIVQADYHTTSQNPLRRGIPFLSFVLFSLYRDSWIISSPSMDMKPQHPSEPRSSSCVYSQHAPQMLRECGWL